jgi:hypothetical protein
MNHNRVISTAVLFLLLGTTIPAFAQKGQEEKGGGGGKAQPAQHQAQQKQQPQRAQQAQHQQQPQRAQQAQHQQQPQRAQQAQRQQHSQRAQQAQRQQPQRAQQAQRQQQSQRGQSVGYNRGNNGSHYGRIPDDHYRAHFGHGHSFHMGRPRMIGGYNRFQYGGYWFGYNERWPYGWGYDDDFYVEYIDGVYYMFNLRHPGFRLTLNLF